MVQRKSLALTSAELVTLIYIAVTSVMMAFMWDGLSDPMAMVGLRGIVLATMLCSHIAVHVISASKWYKEHETIGKKINRAVKIFPLMIFLIWWYPETFEFCSQFPYKDHVFAGIDQSLFGCQPALEFDHIMPSALASELFCLGYYSYYYMMAAVIVFYLLCRYDQLDKAEFIFLGSFFLFYFIFEFLPVAGPQFYFRALMDTGSISDISASASFSSMFAEGFPQVGNYFQTHREMISPETQGIFGQLVIGAQEIGERPTAAFPSSHVGVSTILMLLAWKSRNKYLFWIMFPLYILLFCGTVYIKAHYLIDSIAGFFTAILFYWLTARLYSQYRGSGLMFHL